MNDDILIREFDAALQGEPPLGFDPDNVVTMAARRQRRRRASVLAGVGVAAVAVAAIAVPTALSRAPEAVSPAVTSAPPTIGNWPPAGTSWPTLTRRQLTDQQAMSLDHLISVLPRLFPFSEVSKRGDGFAGTFGTPVTSRSGHEIDQQGFGNAVTVTLGDVMTVDVTVKVPLGTNPPEPLARQCATQLAGIAHGDDVTCTTTRRADGSVLVVTHDTPAFKPGAHFTDGRHQEMLLVQDFRPDGTEVDVESDIDPGAPATDVLPPVTQLTALAVDPGFLVTQ